MTLDEVGDDDEDEEGEGEQEPEQDMSIQSIKRSDSTIELQQKSNVDAAAAPKETRANVSEVKNEVITVKEETADNDNKVVVETLDPDAPVGEDFVRQVVMYFCDLCHKYLPKKSGAKETEEDLVQAHCSSEVHRQAFQQKEQDRRLEEERALAALDQNEGWNTVKKEKLPLDEDQLDYEAESVKSDH